MSSCIIPVLTCPFLLVSLLPATLGVKGTIVEKQRMGKFVTETLKKIGNISPGRDWKGQDLFIGYTEKRLEMSSYLPVQEQ